MPQNLVWSYLPVSDFPLIPSSAFDAEGSVVARPVNAAGDGLTDDTAAIKTMFATGAKVFDLLGKWYAIDIPEGQNLYEFVSKSGIRIYGRGGGFVDKRTYSTASITTILKFNSCSDVVVDCNYIGQEIADPTNAVSGVGYRGAVFVYLVNGCKKVRLNASISHCRYGLLSGDYADPSKGYNKDIVVNLDTYRVGYPVAHYLSEDAHSMIVSEGTHRAAYYAGVKRGSVYATVKNQYIAPIQVLLTDAKTGAGTSRGCSDIGVDVFDAGTTFTGQTYSYLAGISLSRVDPGTVFKNIDVSVNLESSPGVSDMVGGFILNSTVSAILPGEYSANWSNQIKFDNIKISASIDRSKETSMLSTVYDLYIDAEDQAAPSNNPAFSRLTLDRFMFSPGSSGSTKPLYVHAPALSDRMNIVDSAISSKTKDFQIGGKTPYYIGTTE